MIMKTFIFDNTNLQRDEVICYSYSLDVANTSIGQLEKFYMLLLRYFPHSEDNGRVKPHEHNWDNTQQWHAARDHVAKLIEGRKHKSHHWQILGVAFFTLIVLCATLIDTVISRPGAGALNTAQHNSAK